MLWTAQQSNCSSLCNPTHKHTHTHTQIWTAHTVTLSANIPPSALLSPQRPVIGHSGRPSPQQPGCHNTAVFPLNIHKGPSTQLDQCSHTHTHTHSQTNVCQHDCVCVCVSMLYEFCSIEADLKRRSWPPEWKKHQTFTVCWSAFKVSTEFFPLRILPFLILFAVNIISLLRKTILWRDKKKHIHTHTQGYLNHYGDKSGCSK